MLALVQMIAHDEMYMCSVRVATLAAFVRWDHGIWGADDLPHKCNQFRYPVDGSVRLAVIDMSPRP